MAVVEYSIMMLWTKHNVYQNIFGQRKSAKDYASDLIGTMTVAEQVRSSSNGRIKIYVKRTSEL